MAVHPRRPSRSARLTLLRPGPALGPRYRASEPARNHEHDIGRARRQREHHRVSVQTNCRLFVLTESDAVMLILSARQQSPSGRVAHVVIGSCHTGVGGPDW